jgi:hypothetical protein
MLRRKKRILFDDIEVLMSNSKVPTLNCKTSPLTAPRRGQVPTASVMCPLQVRPSSTT